MKNIEGNYNGKLGYRAMRNLEVQDREGWFVKIWKVKAPKEAYILHMCLALCNRIVTYDLMQKQHVQGICVFYGKAGETSAHLSIHYPYRSQAWHLITHSFKLHGTRICSG